MTNETTPQAAPKFKGVIVPAYRGSSLICSNCDCYYSSKWWKSTRFENVIVCRVCKRVHDEKVGEGDLTPLTVKKSRPILTED